MKTKTDKKTDHPSKATSLHPSLADGSRRSSDVSLGTRDCPRLLAQIEAIAAAAARFYDELLGTAGFGWMGWALREGRAISTRRDR